MVVETAKGLLKRFGGGDKAADKSNPKGPATDLKGLDALKDLAAGNDKSNPNKSSAAIRSRHTQAAKPQKTITKLNVGPHTHLNSLEEVEEKTAQTILKTYGFGQEGKDLREGEVQKTEAFFSPDKKELAVTIPSNIAAKELTNSSLLKRLSRLFSKFKPNSALTRLKEGSEIDLISPDNEVTDSKLMQKLTKAGVYSFVAVHKACEKGKFKPTADLLIPVMDLHMMLEFLKKHPPKGLPKKFHALFKQDIEKLEADPKLKGYKFIDEALAIKANKAQYEDETELRKALCCAVDVLGLNADVIVSGDLIGRHEDQAQAEANGKNYHTDRIKYPVIDKDGKAHAVEHPITFVRRDEKKDERLPESIKKVLMWHFLAQLRDPSRVGKDAESTAIMQEISKSMSDGVDRHNASLAGASSTEADSKEDKKS